MIRLEQVEKQFPTVSGPLTVLKPMDLEIKKGEYVSLTGPSGSGKSTLLSILGCLDRPTSGKYWFDEKEVGSISDSGLALIRNKRIGFVFQAFNLISGLSILENVEVPLFYAGIVHSKRRKMALEALKSVGLDHRVKHKPNQLSGGEQQRVAIARALIFNPHILFADEPTGNLDSKTGKLILRLIDDLYDKGMTILMVTHDPAVAKRARRQIQLIDGVIVSDQKQVGEVMAKPEAASLEGVA